MEKVCLMIDFEGFLIPKRSAQGAYDSYQFLLRELAYVRISPHELYSPNSRFFDLTKLVWPLLDPVSQRAIKTQEDRVMGLTYLPSKQEQDDKVVFDYDLRYKYLQELQKAYSKSDKGYTRDVVAFYSGKYEEQHLRTANIPNGSLKLHGCPDFDTIVKSESSYLDVTCGYHKNGKLDTCPRARVTAFRDWWMRRYSWKSCGKNKKAA